MTLSPHLAFSSDLLGNCNDQQSIYDQKLCEDGFLNDKCPSICASCEWPAIYHGKHRNNVFNINIDKEIVNVFDAVDRIFPLQSAVTNEESKYVIERSDLAVLQSNGNFELCVELLLTGLNGPSDNPIIRERLYYRLLQLIVLCQRRYDDGLILCRKFFDSSKIFNSDEKSPVSITVLLLKLLLALELNQADVVMDSLRQLILSISTTSKDQILYSLFNQQQ
ncbi:hypothetical protein GJ496_011175 [Pomphorhynchus laevis]|nr:hypothetical protein GJ496_011175 [Pomphorhynchus laevis]